MGAWGPGTFENDDALDFGADVVSSEDGADLVRRQLEAGGAPGKVDAPAAVAVLVASELVAAARGFPGADLPPPLATWVRERAPGFGEADCRLALAACERVADGSELQVLWSHEEKDAEWVAAVGALRERLQLALGDAAGPAPAGTEAWRLWDPLDPGTSRYVAGLFERVPALAAAAEIRVSLTSRVKSQNEFDADLGLRVTVTPGGDVTVEFAGLETSFPIEGDGDDGEPAPRPPAGAPAVAIGRDSLADFAADLMADRLVVVHRYVGDELELAFAVRTEDAEAGVRAALAAPAARRLLGRKKRPSAVVVSWTGAHDREIQGD